MNPKAYLVLWTACTTANGIVLLKQGCHWFTLAVFLFGIFEIGYHWRKL